MAKMYRNNKEILRLQNENENYKIEEGHWNMPTCCSLLVYLIQLPLVFFAIYYQKGSVAPFYIKEDIYNGLNGFNNI